MDWLLDPQIWAALVTLTVLEIVLGIDNIIFLAIVVGKLPAERQAIARTLGLAGAMVTRILLLLSLTWLTGLTATWFHVGARPVSARDLVLLGGGAFLVYKAVHEMHGQLEGPGATPRASAAASFAAAIAQIMVIDAVFSIDSVITAIGMANDIGVMIAAIVLAVLAMMFFARPLSAFVEAHPTVKVLALAFLIMIGGALMGEGLGLHVPKGYIYFAMAFAIVIEVVNLRVRRKAERLPAPGDSSGV
ncbi:MAG TPA: TerC family protein [Candidatus Binatia bacterium]|nr:TerC family protein [Candidatus Binatia bacterium]